jgi:hypothetical protein
MLSCQKSKCCTCVYRKIHVWFDSILVRFCSSSCVYQFRNREQDAFVAGLESISSQSPTQGTQLDMPYTQLADQDHGGGFDTAPDLIELETDVETAALTVGLSVASVAVEKSVLSSSASLSSHHSQDKPIKDKLNELGELDIPSWLDHFAESPNLESVWQIIHRLKVTYRVRRANGDKDCSHICLLCAETIASMQRITPRAWEKALRITVNTSNGKVHLLAKHKNHVLVQAIARGSTTRATAEIASAERYVRPLTDTGSKRRRVTADAKTAGGAAKVSPVVRSFLTQAAVNTVISRWLQSRG